MSTGGSQSKSPAQRPPSANITASPSRRVTMAVQDTTASVELRITKDRLRLLSHLHVARIGNRLLWVMPASLLATIILTMTTATFRDAFGVTKELWNAVFFLSAAGCAIWLIVALLRYNVRPFSVDMFVKACMEREED